MRCLKLAKWTHCFDVIGLVTISRSVNYAFVVMKLVLNTVLNMLCVRSSVCLKSSVACSKI